MPSDADPGSDLTTAMADAATLGLSGMAELVATAQVGIVVVDRDNRDVYANPVAGRLIGQAGAELHDTGLLAEPRSRDQADPYAAFVADPQDPATNRTGVLLGADGVEREVVCSTFAVDIDRLPHGVAMIWDISVPRDTARTALALARTSEQLIGAGDTGEMLTTIARHAVEGSAALSCGISIVAADHSLAAAGAYGPAGPGYGQANPAWATLTGRPVEEAIEAMTVGTISFAGPPGAPTIVRDARTEWEANPITAPFAANLSSLDWRCGVYVPLSWKRHIIGFFAIFLPSTVAGPSEPDLALYRALADQAAVVVMNARFAAQARTTAALVERSRLARELHDSVSQGLFSMTMHARAAQLSLAGAGVAPDDSIAQSVAHLTELTRGALVEMRALVFELRPATVTESGLLEAVRRAGEMMSDRGQLVIDVVGPEGDLDLTAETEEHLYRIANEALHNIIKHAQAQTATVRFTTTRALLVMTVSDDGIGFDTSSAFPGHLGMSTMAERAATIGAGYSLTSAPGSGTAVRVTLVRDAAPAS